MQRAISANNFAVDQKISNSFPVPGLQEWQLLCVAAHADTMLQQHLYTAKQQTPAFHAGF
jgi:hypothetical protein